MHLFIPCALPCCNDSCYTAFLCRSLLRRLTPALLAASQLCELQLVMSRKQNSRAVFKDIGKGHRLTCICNETKGLRREPMYWVNEDGEKLLKGAMVDYKVARRKGKVTHLRIKKGFSCAEAGEYTCVLGGNRKTVFVTPEGG